MLLLNFTDFFRIDAEDGHAKLDFIDIDVENDTELFLEPTLIEALDGEWYKECSNLIDNFLIIYLQNIVMEIKQEY